MTINTQKLRKLISGVNAATDAHGETEWYAPPGTIYIDPEGIGKADFDFIAHLSPERVTELLDHIDAQAAEIARLREALEESQSLFAAMLHEQRPRCEIEDQMIDNRAALSGESKLGVHQ